MPCGKVGSFATCSTPGEDNSSIDLSSDEADCTPCIWKSFSRSDIAASAPKTSVLLEPSLRLPPAAVELEVGGKLAPNAAPGVFVTSELAPVEENLLDGTMPLVTR